MEKEKETPEISNEKKVELQNANPYSKIREKDDEIISILKKINHDQTYRRAHTERNVLKVLEGDCETAVGVHSKIDGNQLTVEAELFSLDGSERYYEKKIVEKSKFREIGEEIGETLKRKSNNSYKK